MNKTEFVTTLGFKELEAIQVLPIDKQVEELEKFVYRILTELVHKDHNGVKDLTYVYFSFTKIEKE